MLRAYFDLETNANDTGGNGLNGTIQGAGPTFESAQPIALTGGHCATEFTDANYISLPPAIFANMEWVGTIQYSLYYRNGDIGGNRLPYRSKHGAAGDFYIEWGGTMIMLYPTDQGVKVAYSGALTRKEGRWYTVIISWNESGLDVWILDNTTGERQHAFDLNPLPGGAKPRFSVGSNIWLGRSDGPGYNFQGALDNVAFYTTKIRSYEQTIPERRFFYMFGHSWCRGLGSTTGDGYRKQLFLTAGTLGLKFDCYGTYTDGTDIVCPYTNGESGHTSAQILADLQTRIPEISYGANDKSVLLLGPSSLTDLIYGTINSAQHEQNIKDCLTYIYSQSPHFKIFVITQNPSPLYGTTQDYDDFLAAEIEAVAWGKRQGYWVELIDAYSNITVTLSGDDIHPSDAGYDVLGEYIAQQVYYFLTHQSNSVYFKRSLLRTTSVFQFRLNLGNSLADAQTISPGMVLNVGTITEKLSKSNVFSGGVLLPNLEIKLDNRFGRWNKDKGYFKNGFINGSEFIITTQYYDENDVTVIPAFIYRGLIKYVSCEWDRVKFEFDCTLIPATSLLTSEKILPGILSHTSFKNICYKILNRNPFKRHMTVDLDNMDMGWDVAYVYYSDMTHAKVKDVLDKIMLLTGSVYYVDYDGNFIIEPVLPTSPVPICTLRGQDIISIDSESFDWNSQYTGVTWDDGENEIQRVEMDYPTRQQYQYDFRELVLSEKYVTGSAERLEIMNNLLSLFKFIKRRIKLKCKWNPDIIVNKYISIDVPEEAVLGDQFMIWNRATHNWNQGLYWGFVQPGMSFDSTKLWRVVDIKRAARGEKMDLEIVQLKSDDEV